MCKTTYVEIVSPFKNIQDLCFTCVHPSTSPIIWEGVLLLYPYSAKWYVLFLQSVSLKWKYSEDCCLSCVREWDFDMLLFLTSAFAMGQFEKTPHSTTSLLDCLLDHIHHEKSKLLILWFRFQSGRSYVSNPYAARDESSSLNLDN